MSARKAHVLSRIGEERYYEGRNVWFMRLAIVFFVFSWINSVATAASAGRIVGASLGAGIILYAIGVWLSTEENAKQQDLVCQECGTELKPTDDRCSFCGKAVTGVKE